MRAVLSKLNQRGCTFCDRNYWSLKSDRVKVVEQIDNADGFFSYLPVSKSKHATKGCISLKRTLALVESNKTRAEKQINQLIKREKSILAEVQEKLA